MNASPAHDSLLGIVVSHTHWDRAWYLPFQAYRLRLVRMIDRLLDLLEADTQFTAFTLDGQAVLLEDYLEIRPNQEDRLRTLITAGRLLIGPWYTLPDLFLVSGESVIRNLQHGRRLCHRFGGTMDVGYIPDPFGHFAQMPQILRGFGLDSYLFMRGLDAETKATHGAVFDWRAPDGSTVLAVYQRQGYFPAAALGHPEPFGRFEGHTPEVDLARMRLEEAVASMAPLQQERTLLLSNGFDHMPEQPQLPGLLAALNAEMEGLTLVHGTLPAFVEALRAENLPHRTYEGDLIGNADHPILLSVYSTRMYLKQQNHRAEQALIRYAEPLSVLLEAHGSPLDARPLLDHAWRLILRNHPHDDICGCSVDAVHEDDEVRFRQVTEITETLQTEHLEHLRLAGFTAPAATGRLHTDVWVFNPHPHPQRYDVTAHVLLPHPEGEFAEPLPLHPLQGCDAEGQPVPITVLGSEPHVARSHFLETTWGRRYEIGFTVTVPALGYHLVHVYAEEDALPDVSTTGEVLRLEDEHYRLAVHNGALVLEGKADGRTFGDLLQFEYQLDDGDTYSFGPVPSFAPRWADLVEAVHHPTRPHTLVLTHRQAVPERYSREEGPRGETTLEITTEVRLTPQQTVAFAIRYDNTAQDGRLRAVFPTDITTRTALADGHFRLAVRTQHDLRTPETDPERYTAYPGELDYPTHHQGDFVLVEDETHRVWVANQGLPEYELLPLEEGASIAVTLHRAVGMLSVGDGRIRRCQAGPSVPTPGAQCLRPMEAMLGFGAGTISRAEATRLARAFAHPAWVREMPYLRYAPAAGPHPRQASLLELDNRHVVLSALSPTEHPGAWVLRLYNQSADTQAATLNVGFPVRRWCHADLTETWSKKQAQPLTDGSLRCTLAPHEIVTLLLRA